MARDKKGKGALAAERGERAPQPAAAEPAAAPAGAEARSRFLLGTVFLTGGSVMVLELLGTRILAPVFGLSIYVWTAVISVTLMALAAGYQVGGRVADRWDDAAVLFRLIGAVAIWCAGLTLLGPSAVGRMSEMDPRMGPLLGCALLLFVPLFGLAMVGPFVVKLATRDRGHVGRIVGQVTALSTVGSVVGTIATGFVLIPDVGIQRTLIGVTALLLVLATLGHWFYGKGVSGAGMAAVGALLLVPAFDQGSREGREIQDGVTLLEERSSPYAELKVANVDFRGMKGTWMFIGQAPQTLRFDRPYPGRPPYYVDAIHYLEGFHPDPKRYLVIGMGGGTLTEILAAKPGVERVDVVEIDEDVVELARKYFDFEEKDPLRLFVMDGRYFVRRVAEKGSYDFIFFDAFGAGTAPFHLFTLEALEEMKAVLAPGGVFVMNYLGFSEESERGAIDSVLATLSRVFEHHRVALGEEPHPEARMGGFANYLILASDEPIRLARHPFHYLEDELSRDLAASFVRIHRKFRGEVVDPPEDAATLEGVPADRLDRLFDVTSTFDPSKGRLVTDDRNWLEVANARQNEALRENVFAAFRKVFVGR